MTVIQWLAQAALVAAGFLAAFAVAGWILGVISGGSDE